MNYLPYISIAASILTFSQLKQLNLLKNELSYLSEPSEEVHIPLLGENVTEYLPFLQKGSMCTIVQFASPTCASCSAAVEEMLVYNQKYNVPYYVLTYRDKANGWNQNNEEKYIKFVQKFEQSVEVHTASDQLIKDLQIEQFPFIYVINEDGVVIHGTSLVDSVEQFVKRLSKGEKK
ncbi:hypothetical protein [Priestia sp. LL-8]|uniref:hypothetical protein n=1 Tax=Priestia sp. LL-8 TaxID=3110068 RepID=UPI0015F3FFBD|nr:hypothetical protein [Priestia sp. LL-8]MED5247482.1 hypothetical protein [Priestia sp. LL-8]